MIIECLELADGGQFVKNFFFNKKKKLLDMSFGK